MPVLEVIYSKNHCDDTAMIHLVKNGIYFPTVALCWNGQEAGLCGACIQGDETVSFPNTNVHRTLQLAGSATEDR